MENSLKATAEALQRSLVGPCSIIRYLHCIRQDAGGLRIYNTTCVLNSTMMLFGADIPGATGAAGLTREDALIAGLGEAVERYSAAVIPWESLPCASYEDLEGRAIGLDAFELYTEEQYRDESFPCSRWSADTPIYWARGESLVTGEEVLLPAPQVYVPYLYRDTKHRSDFVSMGVSTGAACHSDPLLARLSGLFESVERDAFMVTWMRKIARPRIAWWNDDYLSSIFEKHYAGCGVSFHLFDLSLDIEIPTVLCLAQATLRTGPVCVVGCATRGQYREACSKAMLEAAQCMTWAHYLLAVYDDWEPAEDYSNVKTFQDHVLLYLQRGMFKHLSFLLDTPMTIELPESRDLKPAECYQESLAALKRRELEPVEVTLSTPEIEALGLHVLKIVIPGLAQITGDHKYPALANTRFDTVPSHLGIEHLCGTHRNPMPHPFP